MATREELLAIAAEMGLNGEVLIRPADPNETTASTDTTPVASEATPVPETSIDTAAQDLSFIPNTTSADENTIAKDFSFLEDAPIAPLPASQTPVEQVTEHDIQLEELKDLSYEDIYRLAAGDESETGLSTASRQILSSAIRGSSSTGLGELFFGNNAKADSRTGEAGSTFFGLIDKVDPEAVDKINKIESLLEDKYKDYVERNPDKDLGFFGKAANAFIYGSPIEAPDGVEGRPLVSATRAFTDTAGNSAGFGFGDEITAALFGAEAGQTIRDSREQIYEDSKVAGFASEALGALAPGVGIAKVAGLSKAAAQGAGNNLFKRAVVAGAAEGSLTGAGYSDSADIATRAQDALIGAAIGAGATVILAPIASAASTAIVKLKDGLTPKGRELKALNTFVDSLTKESGVSASDIKAGIKDGKTIRGIMIEKGVPEEIIVRIDQGLIVDQAGVEQVVKSARSRVEDAADIANSARSNVVSAQADAVEKAGNRVEAVRASGGGQTTRDTLAVLFTDDSGSRFHRSLTKKITSELLDETNLLKGAGYNVGDKPTVHIDTNSGAVYVINKGNKGRSVTKKAPFNPKTEIMLDGKAYDSSKITPYEPDGRLIQSAASDIDGTAAQLKEGALPDQNEGARAARLSQLITETENEIDPRLIPVNQKYGDTKSVIKYQAQVDKIFNGKVKSKDLDDLAKIASEISEEGMSANDRLGVFLAAIDNKVASGDTGNMLSGRGLSKLVREAMLSEGIPEHVVNNTEAFMKELSMTSNLLDSNMSITEQRSFLKSILNGTLSRWYLGPAKGFAASAAFNTVQQLADASTTTAAIAKSVKKLKPEVRNRIINNMMNLPDVQFSGLIESIINRQNNAQLRNLLIKQGSVAATQPVVASTVTPTPEQQDLSAFGVSQ